VQLKQRKLVFPQPKGGNRLESYYVPAALCGSIIEDHDFFALFDAFHDIPDFRRVHAF
jgi:hypothetical protein